MYHLSTIIMLLHVQVKAAGRMFNTQVVKDAYGRPVLLFRNEFAFNQVRCKADAR